MPNLRRLSAVFLLACGVVLTAGLPRPAQAQPLIEHVPGNAVVYLGWAGTESLVGDYNQSTLKEVVELIDPERIRAAWRNALPKIRQEIDDPDFNRVYKQLTAMWGASTRGAMAAYVVLPQDNPSDVGVVLLWEPANPQDRKALLDGITVLLDENPANTNTQLVTDGPLLSLFINASPADAKPAAAEALGKASLDGASRFAAATAGVEELGPIVFYADLAAAVELTEQQLTNSTQVLDASDNPAQTFEGRNPAADMIQPLGLDKLGPFLFTAGYDEKRWRTQAFLSVPAPRSGLARLLESPTLTATDLATLPRDTSWGAAVSMDLGILMDVARSIVEATGDQAANQFEQGLAAASSMIGIDVEQQLIRGLGHAWAMYVEPDAAGDSFLGLTFVNQLKDPQGVEQGLRSVQMFGNLALMAQMAEEDVKIQVHTQNYGEHAIHTLGVPFVAPSWSVVDGHLVVGLYPQTILAAIDRLAQPGSLVDHEDLIALREDIGTRRLTAISWVDLPRTAQNSYGNFLMYEHLLTGFASMGTGQPMPTILPPLGKLRPLLEPAHAFAWIDDEGWHYNSRSPFPGAKLLSPQGATNTFVAPMSVGVLLPALGAARRTSRQMTDSTQARGIHQSMITYAFANNGTMPHDIGELIKGNYFTPEYAVSAASKTKLPPDIDAWPIEQQADWVRANADFILVPGLTDDLDPNKIAVFIKPDIYGDGPFDRRGTITRNDNSTSFETDLGWEEAEQTLKQQTGMTLDQLIARQQALAN